MASLYIRNLTDQLVKAVRMKALAEDKRVDELVAPMLEMLVNSKPVGHEQASIAELDRPRPPVRWERTGHDPRTCRVYKCGLCKVAKERP